MRAPPSPLPKRHLRLSLAKLHPPSPCSQPSKPRSSRTSRPPPWPRRQGTLDSAAQIVQEPSTASSSAQPSAWWGEPGYQDRRHDLTFLTPSQNASGRQGTCPSWADCLDEATAACAAFHAGPPIAPDPDLEEQSPPPQPTSPCPPCTVPFWLTFESEPASGPGGPAAVPSPAQPTPAPPRGNAEPPQTTATPPTQPAPAMPKPKADPPQLGPALSCLDMDNYRIERDARGRIHDVLMAYAYRGLASARFMMDNESFTVVSYPFDNPPTVPPPTREPAPAQSTSNEPVPAQQAPAPTTSETTAGPKDEADTDLLGLNSEDGDANRPRGSSFPDPALSSPKPRQIASSPLLDCSLASRLTDGTEVVPFCPARACPTPSGLPRSAMCRLRCARPCNTPPYCPYGLVCAQQMNSPDEAHERHQCSRCHEFDKHRESVWEHFLSPSGP